VTGRQPASSGTGPTASGNLPAGHGTGPAASWSGPAEGGSGQQSGDRPGSGNRRLLRAGLILLAVIQAVVGGWQYFAPHSFYDLIPTVSADTPFNGHLLTDVGGLGLALTVVLAAAAWRLERSLTRVALAASLVYSCSHLAFHAADHAALAPGARALLITSLAVQPALAAALLVLTTRPGAVKLPGSVA